MTRARDRADRGGTSPIKIGTTQLNTDSGDLKVTDTSNNLKKIIADEVHIGDSSNKVIIKKGSDNKVQFQTQASGGSAADSNAGGGTTVFANIAAMTATSPNAGDQALVTANSGLYIFNGSGWYKVATVNTSPTLVSPASGTDVTLSSEGTATTIELVGTDVDEGTTLQYSYAVTAGSLTNGGGTTATVTSSATSGGTYSALAASTNTTNRFIKITPSTNASYAGNFSLNFSISDGTNAATTLQNFGLAFSVSGSLYFDGTGDYIQLADHDDFDLGTGDFTLDAWIWQQNSAASDSHHIINKWSSTGTGKDYILRIGESTGNKLQLLYTNDGSTNIIVTGDKPISNHTWYHVVAMGVSDTIKLFVNGSQQASTGTQGTIHNGTEPLAIGAQTNAGSPSQYFDGYISNARIIKGSAAYSVTAAPANGSFLLDGSGDWVTGTVTAAGTSDFTLECFFNTTSVATQEGIIGIHTNELSGTNQYNGIGFAYNASGNYQIYYNDTHQNSTTGLMPTVNTWHHIAYVRISNVTKLYVDGVEVISVSDAKNYTVTKINIGGYYSNSYLIPGKISNVRYVVGTGVYSSAFTPPTGPLTLTGGTYYSTTNVNTSIPSGHTKLLTANESGGINDDSASSVSLTARGDAVANAASPFVSSIPVPSSPSSAGVANTKLLIGRNPTPVYASSGSYLFNANAENLLVTHADMSMGSGSWTIDFWFYLLATPSSNNWFFGAGTANSDAIQIYYTQSSNRLNFWDVAGTGSGQITLTDFGSETGQWYYVRFCRHGNNHYISLNGNTTNSSGSIITTGQSWTRSYTHAPSTSQLRIGGEMSGNYGWDNGILISDFRVIKGTALQTSAAKFAVPTTPATAVSGTVLLTAQGDSNVLTDNSGTSKTITMPQGTVTADSRKVEIATTDESSGTHALTLNGNTAFHYATPFESLPGGSFYFSGNSNNVVKAQQNADFTLGTGDWTIEGWVYYLGGGSNNNGFWQVGGNHALGFGANYTTSVSLGLASATTLKLYGAGGEYAFGVANAAVADTWVHYAMTKTSSNIYVYKDGTQIYTRSDTTNYSTGDYLGLGAMYGPDQTPNFYLSNFRVIKGTAVYTGNFAVPTGNLTPTGGTYSSTTNVNTSIPSGQCSVLTAITSNSFTDISGNNHIITGVGDPIATKFLPY